MPTDYCRTLHAMAARPSGRLTFEKQLCYDTENDRFRKGGNTMSIAGMTAGQLIGFLFELLLTVLIEVGCLLLFTPLARLADRILGVLTVPLQKPVDKLRERLVTPAGSLSAFGGWAGIAYLSCATVFSCAAAHHFLTHGTTTLEFFTELLYNTVFGAFASLLQGNFSENFTAVAFVSIGVSAFIAGFLSSSLNGAKWYVRLPGHVISLVAYAMLARLLTAPLQAVATWGHTSLVSLFHWQTASFFPVLGKILLLILLGYFALLLILMTLHEYFVTVACVLPAFAVALPVPIILSNITHPAVQTFWHNWQDTIIIVIWVVVAELIQPHLETVHSFVCNQIPPLKKFAKQK